MSYDEFRKMQDGIIFGFKTSCEEMSKAGILNERELRKAFNELRSLLLERERHLKGLIAEQRIEIANRNKGFIKDYWHYLRVAKGVLR